MMQKTTVFFTLLFSSLILMSSSCIHHHAKGNPDDTSHQKKQIKTFKITGKFHEYDNPVSLSDQIKRQLFVLTGASLVVPDQGFYFYLTPESAKSLGADYVLLLPTDTINYVEYKENQTFTVAQVPSQEGTYYTIQPIKVKYDPKKIVENNFKDTIAGTEIQSLNWISNVKGWISLLDNNTPVTYQGIQYISYMDNEKGPYEESNAYYEQKPVREIAKMALDPVRILFDGIDFDNWSKKDWEKWYQSVMSDTSSFAIHNENKLISAPLYENESYSIDKFYSLDHHNGNFYRLEAYTPEKENEQQQLTWYDVASGQINKQYLQPDNKTQYKGFQVNDNTISAITQLGNLQTYNWNDKENKFTLTAENTLLNRNALPKFTDLDISGCYWGNDIGYILFQLDDRYFIASFDIKAKKMMAFKALAQIKNLAKLPAMSNEIIHFFRFGSDQRVNDLYFSIRDESKEKFFNLKLDPTLQKVNATPVVRNETFEDLAFHQNQIIGFSDHTEGTQVFTYSPQFQHTKKQYNISQQHLTDGMIVLNNENETQIIRVYHEQNNWQIKGSTITSFDNFAVKDEVLYSFVPIKSYAEDMVDNLLTANAFEGKTYVFFEGEYHFRVLIK